MFSVSGGASVESPTGATTGSRRSRSKRRDGGRVAAGRLADEAEALALRRAERGAVDAADAHGGSAEADQLTDELRVNQAGQHRDDDLQGFSGGRAQALDPLGLSAEAPLPVGHGRAAAVHDDDRSTFRVQRGAVGQRRVVLAERAATDLDYEGAIDLHPQSLLDSRDAASAR